MSFHLIAIYLVLAATLVRALAGALRVGVPLCGRCGQRLERRALGEPVCRCRP